MVITYKQSHTLRESLKKRRLLSVRGEPQVPYWYLAVQAHFMMNNLKEYAEISKLDYEFPPHTSNIIKNWQKVIGQLPQLSQRETDNLLYGNTSKQLTIDTVYTDRISTDKFLGREGKILLYKVVTLIKEMTNKIKWNLNKIEIKQINDPEIEGWQYTSVKLIFICDFEDADKYLLDFYTELDELIEQLNITERNILQKKVFFNVGTSLSSD